MEIGKIGSREQALFDDMFSGNGKFGYPDGRIDPDLTPDVAAALYASRIEKLFAAEEFGDFDITVDGTDIDFMAINKDGSTVQLGLRVNDDLGLEVDWATGVSIQNGNEIDLDWWFEDQERKFTDVGNLKEFIDQFKEW